MFRRWRRKRQLAKVQPGNGSALPPYRWWQLFTRSIFFIEREEADGPHTYAVDARYFAEELSGQPGDSTWTGEEVPQGGESDADGKSIAEVFDEWLQTDGKIAQFLGDGAEKSEGGSGTSAKPKPGKAPAALYRDGAQLYRSKLPATFAVPGGVIEVASNDYGATRMHFVDEHGAEQVLSPHHRCAEGLRARFGQRFPRSSKMIGAVAIVVLLVGLAVGLPQGLEILTSIDVVAERVGTFVSPIQLPAWANITLLVAGIIAAFERALTIRNHWLIDFDTTWTALG